MRLLLDECMPKRLGRLIAGHTVRTVAQEGWTGKKNGELISLMLAAGFDALITVDKGIRYQQNRASVGVAIVVLLAPSNQLVDLAPLVPNLLVALENIQPGDICDVCL